jgi:plastocyanin
VSQIFRRKVFYIVGLSAMAVAVGLTGYMLTSHSLVNKNNTAHAHVCEDHCVALEASRANPDTLTVKAGEFVQFNSADGNSHSLSLGEGGEDHGHNGPFSSGEFKADEGWRVQFKEPGTYFFHDHHHPEINILVVVYKDS